MAPLGDTRAMSWVAWKLRRKGKCLIETSCQRDSGEQAGQRRRLRLWGVEGRVCGLREVQELMEMGEVNDAYP